MKSLINIERKENNMKLWHKLLILITLLLLAWSPWITKDYAEKKVVKILGGQNATFNYLGEKQPIKDIPKYTVWFPFVRAVYFPNEAVWFVTFWGNVI